MPRNGSGVFSLPAGSTVTNGDTSDASDLNTPLADIATDLNTARPVVAGGTGSTTASGARTALAVPGKAATETISGDWTFSGAVSVTGTFGVSSAAPLATFTDTSDSSTTTITYDAKSLAFDVNTGGVGSAPTTMLTLGYAGTTVYTFSAAGTITAALGLAHQGDGDNRLAFGTDTQDFRTNDTSRLDISNDGVRLGGANARVTTVLDEDDMASDSATALPTQQSVKAYVDAQGGAGMEFIETFDASSDATLDFTGFDATKYDAYVFILSNVVPATDAADLLFRTSTDGGATYDAGSNNYEYYSIYGTFGSAPAQEASAGSTSIQIAKDVGSDTNEDGVSGRVTVFGPHLAKRTRVCFDTAWENNGGGFATIQGLGVRNASEDVDAARFLFSSGAIESGTITLYGLRNA